MQYSTGSKNIKKTNDKPKVEPWQLGVLAIAVIALLWFAISYVQKERAANNVTHVEEKVTGKWAPGSVQERRELEK